VEYKQVIVVREDLAMGMGKLAAQVAYAAVMGADRTKQRNPKWFHAWFEAGQPKVVVKVHSLKEITEIKKHAESLNLTVVQIEDSGMTQIPPWDNYLPRNRSSIIWAKLLAD
jgi:PTH2 family peptidyl-tRNA hydrolase